MTLIRSFTPTGTPKSGAESPPARRSSAAWAWASAAFASPGPRFPAYDLEGRLLVAGAEGGAAAIESAEAAAAEAEAVATVARLGIIQLPG